MATNGDLEQRLERLEKRVAELEQKNQVKASATIEEDDFWALNKLEKDYPEGALLFAGHMRLPAGGQLVWQAGEDIPTLLNTDWSEAAPALAALGHPLRLNILRAVLDGQQTTQELQEQPDLSGAGKLYHHLRELQAVGWLTTLGRGRYSIASEKVIPLLIILQATDMLDKQIIDQ